MDSLFEGLFQGLFGIRHRCITVFGEKEARDYNEETEPGLPSPGYT